MFTEKLNISLNVSPGYQVGTCGGSVWLYLPDCPLWAITLPEITVLLLQLKKKVLKLCFWYFGIHVA